MLHGHLDVVPGRPEQFTRGWKESACYGRGAYDMKGALACLLLALADLREQDQVRVRLGIVPDEESEEEADRGGDRLVEAGFVGDFAITGEPTDMQVGIAAKGVLAMRIEVLGHAAHGATPVAGRERDSACATRCSVNSSRYRLPAGARSSSTDRRSTSAASSAATP